MVRAGEGRPRFQYEQRPIGKALSHHDEWHMCRRPEIRYDRDAIARLARATALMDTAIDSFSADRVAIENAHARSDAWVAFALVLAATFVSVGLSWDISWHLTIGRDTFWTPAHMFIYIGGAVSGWLSGWVAIQTTYFSDAVGRLGSAKMWGGYAPFGIWVSIWGAVAMITSAPFDNWWHEAYGLDVKILSPPHVLLFFGVLGLRLGAGLMVLREQNRYPENRFLSGLFCWIAGLIMGGTVGLFLTEIWPNRQHSAGFFTIVSLVVPFFLAATARASNFKWGATVAALSTMLFHALFVWVLPLFPATPKLGPIYNPVTHMVSAPFPLWTVLPALAFDFIWQKFKGRENSRWTPLAFAVIGSVVFVAVFFPAQWEFANFYLTPAAHNWFFRADKIWSYYSHPGLHWTEFFPDELGWSASSVLHALLAAFVSGFAGMFAGRWMTRVKR